MSPAFFVASGPALLLFMLIWFIAPGEWERPLIRLAHRNEVVALRVVDGADDALPEVGLIVVEDAETGEQVLVGPGDPWFRARFHRGVDERGSPTSVRHAPGASATLHHVGTAAISSRCSCAVIAETQQAPMTPGVG